MSKRRIALLVVLGIAVATMLALAINISAQAQDYGATAGGESGATTSAGTSGGAAVATECPDPRGRDRVRCTTVTTLPHTGFALALFSVIGAGAIGTGVVLARKSRA